MTNNSFAQMMGLTVAVKVSENIPKGVGRVTVIDGKKCVRGLLFKKEVIKKTHVPRINEDREERNGIVKPYLKTIARDIWDYFDAHPKTVSKDLVAIAEKHNWNPSTVCNRFHKWRKFNEVEVEYFKTTGRY